MTDFHALISEGPVLGSFDSKASSATNLEDIKGCWELSYLPDLDLALPPLRRNATNALMRIEQYARPPGNILDFGCGWGTFLHFAKERGWNSYGLEPLVGHAVFARSKFGITVLNDTLRDDTFAPETFDVITTFQVFEHLLDPGIVLEKLYRILKPGGIILIEVPDIGATLARLFGKHYRHFVQDHLNFFSPNTLDVFLAQHSFETVSVYHPTRYMNIRHLVSYWVGRSTPNHIANKLNALTQQLNLNSRLVTLNLRDIVEVIAKKI